MAAQVSPPIGGLHGSNGVRTHVDRSKRNMKHKHTTREKGQALFLAALMVLSVFAMSAAFAGSAAAEDHTIFGEVTDGEGDPIADTEVSTADDVSDETDEDGLYTLEVGEGGSYEVTADADDFESATETVEEEDFDEETNEAEQNFALDAEDETFELTVELDGLSDGDEATVSVWEEDSDEPVDEREGVTDEATFNLEDGEHTLQAEASGYVTASDDVEIPNDENVSLIMELGEADDRLSAEELNDADDFYEGQQVEVTGFDDNTTVELHSGTNTDGDAEEFLRADGDGVVTVDTTGLDGPHVLDGDGPEDNEAGPFWVVEHEVDIEFDSDTVAQSSTTLNYESDNRDDAVDLEASAEDLDAEDLFEIFDGAEEYDNDSVVVSGVENPDEIESDFSDVDTGEYDFTVSVADTATEEELSLEVTEAVDADASFDESTYTQEAGDVVEFTVEMEGNQDTAEVEIIEDDENYEAELEVADVEGDDEVTVYFNTYLAGAGDDSGAFYTDEDSDNTVTYEESEVAFDYDDQRLLPADFDMELYVEDEGEREEVDVATLSLLDGSVDDMTAHIAPEDADHDEVDDIVDSTTDGNTVAEEDLMVLETEASGIYGYLVDHLDGEVDEDLSLEIESPGDRYGSETDLDPAHDAVELVEDPEENRFFVIINTDEYDELNDDGMEDGDEHEVTFEIGDDNAYFDDSQSASTDFSVTERMVELTGLDDEDDLDVAIHEEANVAGNASAAPGTDVRVQLRGTGDNPFLMTDNIEVDENGEFLAEFDTSNQEDGVNFNTTAEDRQAASGDVEDSADSTFVEVDEEQDPHSVTISVEDADGEPVEGADVEIDGETETTDTNGESVLELHHGEYDVTATYDGEESNGTLTVDDETPDQGTLTLGEEDQQLPEDDPSEDENGDTDPVGDNGDADPDDENGDTDPDNGEDPDGEEQPGFGIAVALIALLAAAGFALRNRS